MGVPPFSPPRWGEPNRSGAGGTDGRGRNDGQRKRQFSLGLSAVAAGARRTVADHPHVAPNPPMIGDIMRVVRQRREEVGLRGTRQDAIQLGDASLQVTGVEACDTRIKPEKRRNSAEALCLAHGTAALGFSAWCGHGMTASRTQQ